MDKNMSLYKYFITKFNSLITIDKIRLLKLTEITQYAILYALFSIVVSISIEYIFDKIFPYKEQENIGKITFEVITQCIVLSLAVYYLRKVVQLIPFIFYYDNDYKSYKTMEYQGTITMAFIFFGTQTNLIEKIELLKKKIYQ